MDDVSIWLFKDYKKFISAYSKQAGVAHGFMARLAKAAGCQPSYLSQVLHSKVQLTPDHTWGIAEYLNLSEQESEYLVTLVDHARASSPRWRKKLETKLSELKARAQNIGTRLQRDHLELKEARELYFSSWIWAALHRIVSIGQYQTLDALVDRFGLPRDVILKKLEKMEELGLVRRQSGIWQHAEGDIHLPKSSPLLGTHLNNWRQRALSKAQDQSDPLTDIHFTGVYVISKSAQAELHELLLQTLKRFNGIAGPSDSEELVAFNCDFFVV